MSEWLERIQEIASGYPRWLVLGVGVVVLGLVCVLLSKIMKVLGYLLAVVGILGAAWFGYQYWQDSQKPVPPPTPEERALERLEQLLPEKKENPVEKIPEIAEEPAEPKPKSRFEEVKKERPKRIEP